MVPAVFLIKRSMLIKANIIPPHIQTKKREKKVHPYFKEKLR